MRYSPNQMLFGLTCYHGYQTGARKLILRVCTAAHKNCLTDEVRLKRQHETNRNE